MRGNEFMDRLEAAFPGLLAALYGPAIKVSRERDSQVAEWVAQLAGRYGVTVTPEIVAKARRRHGVAAFRQPKRSQICADGEHWTEAGSLVCQCGEVTLAPREPGPLFSAPAALGPQALELFPARAPEQGPPIPSSTSSGAVDLTDAAADKVARRLYSLIYENTTNGNGAGGAGVAC